MSMTDRQTALDWIDCPLEPARYVDVAWGRADWQRLWLGTQRRPWRTLAVVAGDHRISTYEVASLITALGLQRGESISMADVRDVSLGRVKPTLDFIGEIVAGGERVVFAARTISDNMATIPIARSADCVLLCVSLGSTHLGLVKETVEQVGKERFMGSLLITSPGGLSVGS